MELHIVAQKGEGLYETCDQVVSEAEAREKLRKAAENLIIVEAWLERDRNRKLKLDWGAEGFWPKVIHLRHDSHKKKLKLSD